MAKIVELGCTGVIHESEIFGAVMPQPDNAPKEEEQSDHH